MSDRPQTWVQSALAKLAAAGHRRGGARRALLELLAEQECALTALEIEDALRARAVADAGHGAGGEGVGAGGVSGNSAVGDGAGGGGAGGRGSRRAGRAVSRASVYRILEELEGLGLVQRVETGQAMVRYERAGGHGEHHHHLVCDDCGVVMPFSDAGLERAIATLSARVPLAVVSEHEIVLHGSCEKCAA